MHPTPNLQFIKIDCDSWWYTKAEEYLPFDFTKDCVKFYRTRLLSSGQCHWTRWIRDTCPRLDTCRVSNASSGTGHWTEAVSKKKYPLHCQRTKTPMTHQKGQNRHSTHEMPRNDLSIDTTQPFFFFFLRGTQYHDSLLRDRITNLKIYVTRVHQPNLSHPRLSLKNPSHWSIKRFQSPSVSNPTELWKFNGLDFMLFYITHRLASYYLWIPLYAIKKKKG